MNQKYELTNETITVYSRTLYRIKALQAFSDVKEGDLGGYVESESNLGQHGNCWIYDEAKVFGGAIVRNNATVHMNAKVYGTAYINEYAVISGNATVCQRVVVSGHATITDESIINGDAVIDGKAFVGNSAFVDDKTHISGNAKILKYAVVDGYAYITGDAIIESRHDYMVFQDNWLTGDPFTYTKSNKMWKTIWFYGTSKELLEYAYKRSNTSGKNYELYVNLVNQLVDYETISHSENKHKKLFDLINTDELQHFLTVIAAEEEDLIMQENWLDSDNPLLTIQKEIYQKLKLHEDKVLFAKTVASQYAISQTQKTLGELVKQYGIVEINQYFKEYEIIE